eukprot:CAMPEP_0195300562 /NCGR_PEP_ID=MMETSP0707-20130614/27700_1 /TAXON_ID=33640 /ORGANISM="Asterionellopsis glacialis, Strain CCMP134" /LENGTH=71 /DNA_ID=CAMNT_0040363289 /DNA_START=116 /DNA_END=328 /DNA_ORIENTATION=-
MQNKPGQHGMSLAHVPPSWEQVVGVTDATCEGAKEGIVDGSPEGNIDGVDVGVNDGSMDEVIDGESEASND